MYRTLIIVVSTLTDTRFKDKIVNIVFEVSWRTQTMTRRLEIISDVGLFCSAWLFFSVHISADSCTLNLLYVISKLQCKIDQRELEMGLMHTKHYFGSWSRLVSPFSFLYKFRHGEESAIPLWKLWSRHSFYLTYTGKFWAIYEEIMTKKNTLENFTDFGT